MLVCVDVHADVCGGVCRCVCVACVWGVCIRVYVWHVCGVCTCVACVGVNILDAMTGLILILCHINRKSYTILNIQSLPPFYPFPPPGWFWTPGPRWTNRIPWKTGGAWSKGKGQRCTD